MASSRTVPKVVLRWIRVKAALALAHWDGLDVPAKVLETIDSMDKQETMSGPETVDNQ